MEEQEVQQPTTEPSPKKASLFSNKLTLILIAIIGIILAVIIGVLLLVKPSPQPSNTTNSSTNQLPQATIYFEPGQNIGSGVGVIQQAKVFIDTQGRDIDRAVLVFQYDPKVLSNVAVTQTKDPNSAISNAFGTATISNEPKGGLASIELVIPQDISMQKGKGQVATISFVRKTPNPTSISFAANSGFTTRSSETITPSQTSLMLYRVTTTQ